VKSSATVSSGARTASCTGGFRLRFCKAHWDELREKIRERGLYQFVAKDGAEAMQRMVEGGFDPLMSAHNRILENALSIGGLGLMVGDLCPLCELINQCQCGQGDGCPFKAFTTKAADEQLEWAKEKGLLGQS